MNIEAERLKRKLEEYENTQNIVRVQAEELDRICKERLDFGFDSIYFRYAEVCDELALYRALETHEDPIKTRKGMEGRKMHFYKALEQLVHAHEESK